MKPGMKIWIILVSIVLFWIGVFCFADNLDDRAANMAEKALRASVHNPESIRILGVSKPDSVFGHTYITQEEKMALSMAMVKINRKVMEATDGLEDFDPDDKETAALMERYSPGDTPLLTRSMYWYLMRRSLNQRSAFFVSKDLLFPKIWIFMTNAPYKRNGGQYG